MRLRAKEINIKLKDIITREYKGDTPIYLLQ